MKTLHKLNIVITILLFALFAVSCIPEQQSIGSAGATFVKLHPAVYNMLAFDAKTTTQTGLLFEVRRDVPNETDLNSTTTVVLKYDTDTAMLKKYNSKNGTKFIPLPPSLGTVSPAITSGTVTLNFAAGDFGKPVNIVVPSAGSFDFSKNYALAFKVLSVTGTGTLSASIKDTIVCEILAKNRWDGIYDVTGTFVDYVTAAWTGYYPKIVQLRTTGALTVSKYDTDFGVYTYIFDLDGTGNSVSQFGAWTPCFVFDANNNVVNVINSTTDPLPRQRTAVMYTGAGAINKYNATTKTMDVSYQMSQLNVSPVLRCLVVEQYVYKGPR
jgi:hypothetical protein